MKLYVRTKKGKIYLNQSAKTRRHLAEQIGSKWFQIDRITYNVNDVYAEDGENNATSGVIIGGLIGLLGGPIGVIGGGIVGGMIGNENDRKGMYDVRFFNKSNI